ncbi:MAG: hypothetical protein GF381_04140 [Candidatus Pacebacteria bacterium]|nr:hypothetical protein [Candidatus Paceibacterota bacterium]
MAGERNNPEANLIRVAVVGGSCAGKTTVTQLLKRQFDKEGLSWANIEDCPIRIFNEAWTSFQVFAAQIFSRYDDRDHFTTEDISELYHWLLTKAGTFGRERDWLFYYFYLGLNFVSKLNLVKSRDDLRKLIQANLLLVQLALEHRLDEEEWSFRGYPQIFVFDGSLVDIVSYWPPMSLADYSCWSDQEFLQEVGSVAVLAQSYEVIIVLETLVNVLRPEEYLPLYHDGRRLDPPDHARQMHQRLQSFLSSHPCCFLVPGEMSEEEKAGFIHGLLIELRLMHLEDFEGDVRQELKQRLRGLEEKVLG